MYTPKQSLWFLLFLLTPLCLSATFAHGQNARSQELITAVKKQDLAKVKRLLAAGANPNAKDEDEISALVYAADVGSVPICEALLQAGAKINDEKGGSSALYSAVESDQTALVKLLLSKGASLAYSELR